jgi:uncharacterized membrane protein
MKLAVGVMLSSFGMFWGAQGAGAHWPGDDAALLAIVPTVLLVALALARTVRRVTPADTSDSLPAEVVDPVTVSA